MNLSGQAVAPLARQFELAAHHILIIADEMDLPLGKLKMQPRGGAGGHNGHRSVIASLGTQDYPRIRIGIGKGDGIDAIDHVLSTFDRDERTAIDAALERAREACRVMVNEGLERALTFANNA
jgi:PTH1 family peptidyl-tRNA hydrolase